MEVCNKNNNFKNNENSFLSNDNKFLSFEFDNNEDIIDSFEFNFPVPIEEKKKKIVAKTNSQSTNSRSNNDSIVNQYFNVIQEHNEEIKKL